MRTSTGKQAKTGSVSVTIAADEGSIPVSITAGNNNIGDVDIATIAAGENLIGAVAGKSTVITPAIVVSTSAYSVGDSIGGKITLSNAARVSGGISYLQSIMIVDRSNQKPVGTILIFDVDPIAATITDNAAFVASTNDFNVVASIPVASADYVTIGGKAYANLSGLGRSVKSAATSLFCVFVATNTPTFAATTDMQIKFGFLQD